MHQPITGSREPHCWFLPRPWELLSCIKLLGGRIKIETDRIHLRWAVQNAFTGSVKFNIDDKVGWDPLPYSKQINVQVLTTGYPAHFIRLHFSPETITVKFQTPSETWKLCLRDTLTLGWAAEWELICRLLELARAKSSQIDTHMTYSEFCSYFSLTRDLYSSVWPKLLQPYKILYWNHTPK